MLAAYLLQTQRLLQNPAAPVALYSAADLTSYINTARGQLAGEAECVRTIGTINTVAGVNSYSFSGINIGTPTSTGIDGVFNIQTIQYVVASGQKWISGYPESKSRSEGGAPRPTMVIRKGSASRSLNIGNSRRAMNLAAASLGR